MKAWLRLLRARGPELRRTLEQAGTPLQRNDYIDVGYAADPGVVTGRITLRVHFKRAKSVLNRKPGPRIDQLPVRLVWHESLGPRSRRKSTGLRAQVRRDLSLEGGMNTGSATLGALVVDRTSRGVMALSCNHVWDEEGLMQDAASIGRVTRSDVDLDAAVARIGKATLARHGFSYDISGTPGGIHGMVEPRLGMLVVKTGEVTKTTYGYIEGISTDQFSIAGWPGRRGSLSDNGDSGSVWIDVESGAAVGLHWGGEHPDEPEQAYAHWMTRIARRLDIEVSRRTSWNGRATVGPAITVCKQIEVMALVQRSGRLAVQIHDDRRRRAPSPRTWRPAPTTDRSVAMVTWKHSLVMAWVDRDTHQVHIARSRNGGSRWSVGRSLGERTPSAPALTVIGPRLALAWRDASTDRIRVAFTTDGRRWSSKVALPFKTTSGPALTTLRSQLVVAWRDARKNVIKVAIGNRATIERVHPKQLRFKTQTRPALQEHAGCLYLAWTSPGTGRLHLASSHDGRRWSESPLALHDTAVDGPALASQGHDLIWAWTDPQGRVTTLRTERRSTKRPAR